MDVVRILQKVAALNGHIQNSLVRKGSQPPPLVSKLVDLINSGKMILDSIHHIHEKPDLRWNQAIIMLRKCQETLSPEIFNAVLEETEKFTKPHKFVKFKEEWEKDIHKDNGIELAVSASNIQNLLKAAAYIEKSADNITSAKMKLAKLIESHIGHIAGLIEKGQPEKAKEYLEVIRPQGWERNAERNIDKLYEQVVRGLSEKLEPEAFQALGL